MPTRKPAAATVEPDEAQAAPVVDADVVEETPADKPPTTLAYLQSTVAAMKTSLRAENSPRFEAIEGELKNLAALVEATSAAQLEVGDDSLADKLTEISAQVEALTESRVTPVAFNEVAETVKELERRALDAPSRVEVGEDEQGIHFSGAFATKPAGEHILKAIHQVMKAVTFVPKSGQYNGGGSGTYKFRKFDDTAAALGAEFRTYGIFVQKRVINRTRESYMVTKKTNNGTFDQRWTETVVEVEYIFTSLVDGSELKVQSYGEGKDNSDKSTAKAETMAMKTALTQAFMIPTDEPDPDQSRPGDGDYAAPVGGGEGDPPPVDEPQYTKEELALGAFKAASAPGATRKLLTGIWEEATERRIMNVSIQPRADEPAGPLGDFLTAIATTLPPA